MQLSSIRGDPGSRQPGPTFGNRDLCSWRSIGVQVTFAELEPTLTRHGYTARVLAELLDTKPGEVREMFRQTLGVERLRELKEQMLAAGLPV